MAYTAPAGDFYIDPWRPVERALVTHAHTDHARWGCRTYLTCGQGQHVLRARVGDDAAIETLPYAEQITIGGARVSFFPAGHILGSCQVRVEVRDEVWVVSGDYKTKPDVTCDPFEPVPCHTFITESTFGLPIFCWRPDEKLYADINNWWRENQERSRVSVIFAYALGKSQRLLAGLDWDIGPIVVHGAVGRFVPIYSAAGIAMPEVLPGSAEVAKAAKGRALIIAPPSAAGSPWLRKFGAASLAFASGWMAIRGTRRRRALDRGFIMSDHADWPGLQEAIKATGASRIGVTHGYSPAMVHWLKEQGYDAWTIPTRYRGEEDEEGTGDEPLPDFKQQKTEF